ncbi:unnamed protein product [Paramecium octaurelia]|uniref:Uncharacterized protein n=1 Tax=Paramecium octaurelia TaxID=43137 RepID=A0A8S1VYR8_PAROT|nr:unnamed protein product [Paramecium octaurelia]
MKVSEYLHLYKDNRKMRDFSEYANVLSLTSKSRKENITFTTSNSQCTISKSTNIRQQSPNKYASIAAQRKKLSVERRLKTSNEDDWEQFAAGQVQFLQQHVKNPIAIVNLNINDNGIHTNNKIYLYEDSNIEQIVTNISRQYKISDKKKYEIRQELLSCFI